ncbi:hypothetical protein Tco_0090260 [Tanacetum coccineum]
MSQSPPLRHQPPTATNRKKGSSGCRFHKSEVSQIIRCEGVDWEAMIVSQNMDTMAMDGGGCGIVIWCGSSVCLALTLRALGIVEPCLQAMAQKVPPRQQKCYGTRKAMAPHLGGSLVGF